MKRPMIMLIGVCALSGSAAVPDRPNAFGEGAEHTAPRQARRANLLPLPSYHAGNRLQPTQIV